MTSGRGSGREGLGDGLGGSWKRSVKGLGEDLGGCLGRVPDGVGKSFSALYNNFS